MWTYNRVVWLQNGSLSLAFPEVDDIEEFAPTYCCHNRFFFDNVFEEINLPGEYYINVTSRIIYMIPPDNWAESGVTVSGSLLNEPVIIFDADATDISFVNVKLEQARGMAIDAGGAERIFLSRLEITGFGLEGVTDLGAHSSLTQTHIHDIGAGGVSMEAGDKASLTPGNATVSHCHIHDWAYWNKVWGSTFLTNKLRLQFIV